MTTKTTTADPAPALKPSRIYFGDNGRLHCGALRCAGMSAHFTGVALDGALVTPVRQDDVDAWLSEFGERPKCETCGLEA